MTKLDELIKELCPDGVEYKTLGEVASVIRGERITKNDLIENGEFPVMSGGTSFFGRYNNWNRDANIITVAQYGSAGYVDFITERFWANDVCYSVLPDDFINNKFLYYVLCNNQKLLYKLTTKAIPDCLPKERLESISIPVPPLPVQEEIVRILDSFTELTARRKQYEYYRDALLTPPFGSAGSPTGTTLLSGAEASEGTRETKVEFFKLKDLCKSIKDGMHNLPKSSLEYGEYPILSAQNIYNNQIDYNAKRFVDSDIFKQENKRTNIEVGDVLLTIVATIGRSAVVKENRKVLIQRSVCALKPNEKVLPGYLKYSLDKSDIQNYMIKNAHGSAQAGLYLNQVEEITIPLPPLSVQQRIVNVLDNFDAICSDLKIGLPAEIDARKKQYEYYRDLLLSFNENVNNSLHGGVVKMK
mgnify:CR=1 FL=1